MEKYLPVNRNPNANSFKCFPFKVFHCRVLISSLLLMVALGPQSVPRHQTYDIIQELNGPYENLRQII